MRITGTADELKQLYEDDNTFREYVKAFCKSRDVEKDFALQTQTVKEYALYIVEREADKLRDNVSSCECEKRDPDGDLLTSCKCDC